MLPTSDLFEVEQGTTLTLCVPSLRIPETGEKRLCRSFDTSSSLSPKLPRRIIRMGADRGGPETPADPVLPYTSLLYGFFTTSSLNSRVHTLLVSQL